MTIFIGFPVYEWDIRFPSLLGIHATMPPPGAPPPPPHLPSTTSVPPEEADAAKIAAPPYYHIDGPNFVRFLCPLGNKLVGRCEGDGQLFAQAGHNTGFFIPHGPLYANLLFPLHIAFSSCRWIFPVPQVLLEGSPAAISSSMLIPFLHCGDPMPRPGFVQLPLKRTVTYTLSLEEWLGGMALFLMSMGLDAIVKRFFGYSSAYFSKGQLYRAWGGTWASKVALLLDASWRSGVDKAVNNLASGFVLDGRINAPFSLASIDMLGGKTKILIWEWGSPPPGGVPQNHPYLRRRLMTTPRSADAEDAICPRNEALDVIARDLPRFEEVAE